MVGVVGFDGVLKPRVEAVPRKVRQEPRIKLRQGSMAVAIVEPLQHHRFEPNRQAASMGEVKVYVRKHAAGRVPTPTRPLHVL